ncbi:DASS family sodium-coupled anion symporter [Micropruina sp.]|uniref:DASS family sodium-coupled anion symporter n=1 Tax=Micropruina sp. TaxID=2737536 RepID=UPI0039E33881
MSKPVDTTDRSRGWLSAHPSAWKTLACVLPALIIALIPDPAGVEQGGMIMLGIFVGTIVGFILQPLPNAPVGLIGVAAAMIAGTHWVPSHVDADTGKTVAAAMQWGPLTTQEALAGFGDSTAWLIAAAFIIADGFVITGLGRRIALNFLARLGRTPLGLAYGLGAADLIVSPGTPSLTARYGGVIYPLVLSVSKEQGSEPFQESRKNVGAYLTFASVAVSSLTSSLFLTAMAGNPLMATAVKSMGLDFEMTWGNWFLAAVAPVGVALIVIPWVAFKIFPPSIGETPEAPANARNALSEMGPMSVAEKKMLAVFLILLLAWSLDSILAAFGLPKPGINATMAALVGVALMFILNVVKWADVVKNGSIWSTLLFYGAAIAMATKITTLGVTTWVGESVSGALGGLAWPVAFGIVVLAYFFARYLFASATAHVLALYPVFLSAAIAVGTPPMLAAFFLAIGATNTANGLTPMAGGAALTAGQSGMITTSEWFSKNLVLSLVMLAIFAVVGIPWMLLVL